MKMVALGKYQSIKTIFILKTRIQNFHANKKIKF